MSTKKQITARKLANTDQAVEDLELTPLHYRLLGLMVKLAIGEAGICRRAQTDLAKRLGIHARTVQRGLEHLVDHKYLKPIGQARKGFVQAYQVFRPEEVTPAPYLKPEPAPAREHTTPVSPHTTPASRSYGAPTVHVPLVSPLPFPSDHRETGAGGPRGLEGLGPPPMESKRLSNGHALASANGTLTHHIDPPTPNRPFPEVDAKIRTLIAEPKLFAGSRTMEIDGRSILINCPTDGMASALRPFADDIADGLGVDQVRFSVSHGPGLTKGRLQ